MKKVVVILAGGQGERLWPKSRRQMPKQFLDIIGNGKTMIQQTVERIKLCIPMEDIYIVTNEQYKELIEEQLEGVSSQNILYEPMAKGTAPCIGLATTYIREKYTDAMMIVLPADHLIRYDHIFVSTLEKAVQVVENKECLVTIGIRPSYPEVGYGYIRYIEKEAIEQGESYKVQCFVEKPCLEKAKDYLKKGKYLWNSGMFVWRVSTIENKFRQLLPELYQGIIEIGEILKNKDKWEKSQEEIKRIYATFKVESIDYAIMEKAKDIEVLIGDFGWDDVGSWLALDKIQEADEEGNRVVGGVIMFDSRNNIIQGKQKLIATVGVENLIVVDTEDILLICNKETCQHIKEVLNHLKDQKLIQYL